jgi:class 3 adenylate cyclase
VLGAAEAKFCDACGIPLSDTPPRPPALGQAGATISQGSDAPEAIAGERKIVTALFADLKGSTELMRELDPEEAQALVDPVLQLMMTAVHRYDGYVAQPTGDGIFAMFGAPIAHEDHAQRALHAALAIQDELRRYGEKSEAAGQPMLEARICVNTGEMLLRLVNTGAHADSSSSSALASLRSGVSKPSVNQP